jgi:HAD superfamily hydrolase (TIGR01509 family)
MKALIFDLDGTLIDSVYPHTLAWQQALAGIGMQCPAWEIHRRIGMSGKLLVKAIARQQGRELSDAFIEKLEKTHSTLFHELAPTCPPLPGARELLAYLHDCGIAHGIATSGKRSEIEASLQGLSLSDEAVVVDGAMVAQVKPEPDLFLLCQDKLGVERSQCVVVGDAIWDIHAARRSGILAVGLMSGGSGEQELYNAGAMRVYPDAAGLLESIDELGFDG